MLNDDYRSCWTYLYDVPHSLSWIDAGGVSTRCLQAGNPAAPIVLMLHGTAGSLENCVANIGAFAKDFRVLAIDLVGNGLSDKPSYDYTIASYVAHVAALLDALAIDRVSILGVSLGSWVAFALALAHPARVDRIIAVAPAGTPPPPAAAAQLEQRLRSERLGAALDPSWANIAKIFDGLILLPKNRAEDLIAIRKKIYEQPNFPEIMERSLAPISSNEAIMEADWKRLHQPLLLVTSPAKGDEDFFNRNARQIADWAPDVTMLPVPEADHWSQFETPQVFNPAAIAFLKGNGVMMDTWRVS